MISDSNLPPTFLRIDILTPDDKINILVLPLTNHDNFTNAPLSRNFLYLRDDAEILAVRDFVEKLTHAIGIQRSALLADACIADVIDALKERILIGASVANSEHSAWLKQKSRLGLFVLAYEVSCFLQISKCVCI